MKQEEKFQEKLNRIYTATSTKTQQQLAKVLGVQQSSVSDAKSRGTIPKPWLLLLMRKYNINPTWVEEGKGDMYLSVNITEKTNDSELASTNNRANILLNEPRKQFIKSSASVPVHSTVYSGETDAENNMLFDIENYISIPEDVSRENTIVFKLNGRSMEPTLLANSIVGVDLLDKKLISGEIYAFCLPPQGVYFARVFHAPTIYIDKEVTINLTSENKTFPTVTLPLKKAEEAVLGKAFWVLNLI